MGSKASSLLGGALTDIGSGWNSVRNDLESAGSVAGNYLLPGSSLLTSNLVSKGSQDQLNSPVGRVANTAAGLAGAGIGSGVTGIKSASDIGAGWSGLGNTLGVTGEGSLLGTEAGAPLEGGAQGATQGSGVLGAASKGISGLGSALSTGTGGGGSSYLPLLTAAGGTLNTLNATDQAKKDLLDAQNKSLAALSPYLASGAAANSRLTDLLGTSGNIGASDYGSLSKKYTAEDLQNDPGYKFQLAQGNQALDRQQAAKGNYFSGGALKAAQDYGQGLADTTFKDAYARDAATKAQTYNMYAGQSGAGQNAANSAGNLYDNTGNANAGADISSGNSINQLLSSLLSGSGAKRPVNIGGQVVYI